MKKKVMREETTCDFCGNGPTYEKCLGCGKDVCFECQETKGIDYKHSVHFSGSGDGFFCNKCLSNPSQLSSNARNLLYAYGEIKSLRDEEEKWYADFKRRAEEAERNLKEFLGGPKCLTT